MPKLSNRLLDNFGIRPSLGKRSHIHQVGARKPLHFREGQHPPHFPAFAFDSWDHHVIVAGRLVAHPCNNGGFGP